MNDPSRTLLAFGAGTWRWPRVFGSPRYHLWTLAERGWRVVYIEPPVRPLLRARWWQAPDRAFSVYTPAWVPPFGLRAMPCEAIARMARRATAARLAAEGRRAWAHLHGPADPAVVWLGAPWHGALLPRLPIGSRTIHHVYDELAASPALTHWQRRLLAQWEAELLAKADWVACSSMPQLEARQSRTAGRLFLLENGVPENFLANPLPPKEPGEVALLGEMQALKRPIYAYGGVADRRLSPHFFRALVRMIEQRGGTLAVLGKLDSSLDTALREQWQRSPSVWLAGEIPHALYPSLYAAADCLVMAHRRHPFTDGMYPEKMNEYLATGKPIVARRMAELDRLAGESGAEGTIVRVDNPRAFALANIGFGAIDTGELSAARKKLVATRTWGRLAEALDTVVTG